MSTTNYNTVFIQNKTKLTLNVNGNSNLADPVEEPVKNETKDALVILFDKTEVEMHDIKQKMKASKKAIVARFGSMTPDESELPEKGRSVLKKMLYHHQRLLNVLNSRQLKRKDLKLRLNAERRELLKGESEKYSKLTIAKFEYEAALNSLKISIDKEKFKHPEHIAKMLQKINDVLERNK